MPRAINRGSFVRGKNNDNDSQLPATAEDVIAPISCPPVASGAKRRVRMPLIRAS
jgi:hypothetical protein